MRPCYALGEWAATAGGLAPDSADHREGQPGKESGGPHAWAPTSEPATGARKRRIDVITVVVADGTLTARVTQDMGSVKILTPARSRLVNRLPVPRQQDQEGASGEHYCDRL